MLHAARTTRSRSSPSIVRRHRGGLGASATRRRPSASSARPDFSSAFLELDVVGALQLALLPAIVVDPVHGPVRLALDVHRRRHARPGLTEPDGRPLNLGAA